MNCKMVKSVPAFAVAWIGRTAWKHAKRLECVGFSDALTRGRWNEPDFRLEVKAVLKSPQSKRFAKADTRHVTMCSRLAMSNRLFPLVAVLAAVLLTGCES